MRVPLKEGFLYYIRLQTTTDQIVTLSLFLKNKGKERLYFRDIMGNEFAVKKENIKFWVKGE